LFSGAGLTALLTIIAVRSESLALGGQEGNVMFGVQTLLRGAPLYSDPRGLPFIATQYTPIYHELTALLCRVAGVTTGDIQAVFRIGRVISATASLVLGLVMFILARRYGSAGPAARWMLAFLLVPVLGAWAFMARPDALYMALAGMILLLSMRYAEDGGWRDLLLASIFTGIAFWTKQTAFILFPLPFIAKLARGGLASFRIRDALLHAIVLGGALILMTPAMAVNFQIGLGNGIDLAYAKGVYLEFLIHHAPLLLAMVGACFLLPWRGYPTARTLMALAAWLLAAGMILSLKWGSQENYLHEFLMVGLALTALAGRPEPGQRKSHQSNAMGTWLPASLNGPLLTGLLLAELVSRAIQLYPWIQSARAPRAALYQTAEALRTAPELAGKPVAILDFNAFLFLPERAVFVPLEVLTSSAGAGHYDLAAFRRAVDTRAICYAISDQDTLTRLRDVEHKMENQDVFLNLTEAGPTLLKDFRVSRQVGSKLILVSDHCLRP
jgi:hypothetical protein